MSIAIPASGAWTRDWIGDVLVGGWFTAERPHRADHGAYGGFCGPAMWLHVGCESKSWLFKRYSHRLHRVIG